MRLQIVLFTKRQQSFGQAVGEGAREDAPVGVRHEDVAHLGILFQRALQLVGNREAVVEEDVARDDRAERRGDLAPRAVQPFDQRRPQGHEEERAEQESAEQHAADEEDVEADGQALLFHVTLPKGARARETSA